MHHADGDFDASTGIRFHPPLSILISMLIKIAIVLLLGPPALAVLLAEIIPNVTAVFNHGNIYIPPSIDSKLRLLLVTPDMHRVHHSTAEAETNSNFGFNFPWWDRLFGSYRESPGAGHADMKIGVPGFAGEGGDIYRSYAVTSVSITAPRIISSITSALRWPRRHPGY